MIFLKKSSSFRRFLRKDVTLFTCPCMVRARGQTDADRDLQPSRDTLQVVSKNISRVISRQVRPFVHIQKYDCIILNDDDYSQSKVKKSNR